MAAGSIIQVSNVATGGITSTVGSTSLTGVGGFGNLNEGLYAYTGVDANTPTTFLTAMFNGTADGSGSTLTGTGLTLGSNAIEFGNNHDIFEYTGDRGNESSFSGYLGLVNNASNWISEDGAGNQSGNGLPPDTPFSDQGFSTTKATPEPSS